MIDSLWRERKGAHVAAEAAVLGSTMDDATDVGLSTRVGDFDLCCPVRKTPEESLWSQLNRMSLNDNEANHHVLGNIKQALELLVQQRLSSARISIYIVCSSPEHKFVQGILNLQEKQLAFESLLQEENAVRKKYGERLPRKPPLISKDHERAYFDSADWALGKQGAQKPKGPLEALRPKLQPTPTATETHQRQNLRNQTEENLVRVEFQDGCWKLMDSGEGLCRSCYGVERLEL
ncbi:hypothetical protein KIW84_040264 [Lathyrus oleraceus]|uniref:Uncharacterized protein n=1 Tax=Pisum sativum TaxID=3888 RepID=A0A9D5API2_PEA|nr:hypothetical protein KIW84_040264 [Pisum sativum]